MEHELIDGTLYNEAGGIIGRCKCGWTTGHYFSSFGASAAFSVHKDQVRKLDKYDHASAQVYSKNGVGG